MTQKEFKQMIPNTEDKIMESVFEEDILPVKMSRDCEDALMDLSNMIKKKGAHGVIEFLTSEDAVTKHMYEKTDDGKFIYPYANSGVEKKALKEGISQYVSNSFDDQTCKHHQESLTDHTYAVVGHFMEGKHITDEKSALDVLTALLHDIGKKYTMATNAKGEVCFYGHEAVSAYIAARSLYDFGKVFDKKQIREAVTVIAEHLSPKVLWQQKLEAEQDFIRKNGKALHDKVVKFSECDIGYEDREAVKNDPAYAHGKEIIDELEVYIQKQREERQIGKGMILSDGTFLSDDLDTAIANEASGVPGIPDPAIDSKDDHTVIKDDEIGEI